MIRRALASAPGYQGRKILLMSGCEFIPRVRILIHSWALRVAVLGPRDSLGKSGGSLTALRDLAEF